MIHNFIRTPANNTMAYDITSPQTNSCVKFFKGLKNLPCIDVYPVVGQIIQHKFLFLFGHQGSICRHIGCVGQPEQPSTAGVDQVKSLTQFYSVCNSHSGISAKSSGFLLQIKGCSHLFLVESKGPLHRACHT